MTAPTVAEKALLRKQPHYTRLWLSVYKPQTIFQAQVNDVAIAKGEQIITYDTVTTGNYLGIGAGMTLYVGSTAGGKDKGAIFVFTRDATTITVGENSHINWEDDDYLTVVNYHQIWPVYPRYVQSGTDITVYKIWSVAYTNQNEDLGSFIVMGGNYAGFRTAGTCSVYYDASESENVYGTTGSTYSWSFEGGDPTGSTAITPGWVDYDTCGHYRTLLRIDTPGGNADVGVRHISIYDRPGVGPNVPILRWGLESFSGSRDAGGYRARIWVREDFDDIVDGALVVIFADDTYGTTNQSIGGNNTNRESIVFSGYILDGSIEYDYQTSMVSFEVGSPTEIMKVGEAFSVSVEDSRNPTADANGAKGGDPWFYLVDLTVKRALYHYLRWHSSVYTLCDIHYTPGDVAIQYFDANRDSLYSAVATFFQNTLSGQTVCDRQGAIWFDVNAEAIINPDTNIPLNMSLDNHDWINNPYITERTVNEVSFIEAGGVAYSGATGTFAPYLSDAPGVTPAYRGRNEKMSGWAVTGQAHLNQWVGNIYAYRNSRYPSVRLDLAGNYRNFDIAPQETVKLTLNAEDNYRGIAWNQKKFVVQSMDWKYDPEMGIFKPTIDVSEMTEGFPGDTVTIPVEPPDDGYEEVPPLPPPVFPPFAITGDLMIFIPCLGGNEGGDITTRRTWMDSTTSRGVEINSSGDQVSGVGLIPAGAKTVTFYPVMNVTGATSVDYYFSATVYDYLGTASYVGYINATLNSAGGGFQWLTTDTVAHTIGGGTGALAHCYIQSSGVPTNSKKVFIVGWMAILTY